METGKATQLVGIRIQHRSEDYGMGTIRTAIVIPSDEIRVEFDFDNGRDNTNFKLLKCIDQGILSLIDDSYTRKELLRLARNGDQSGIKWEFESDENKNSGVSLLDEWEYNERLNRPHYLHNYIPKRLFDLVSDEEG